ncbi:MAG: hypothetical protein WDK96_01930 [Candidatus Paceibacterota bacterium]|jgi:precorrin-6B methylase 2
MNILFIIEIILLLGLLIFFVFFTYSLYFSFRIKVPFVPVSKKIISKIITNLKLEDGQTLYDLGCGDGRVLFDCKKEFKNINCVGVEIAPTPLLLLRIKNFFTKKDKKIKIIDKNFFEIDLKEADRIFVYLFPEIMDKLLPKLEKELKSGTLVVSCDFQFSSKNYREKVILKNSNSGLCKNLYIYEF